ncbi:Molybdopterin molybdenumtransferase [Candidatus Hydrogenisulfobacillus filiaventi]|uniref:Molybdopterin molybdenumtransferase n=1 Tax=Candidatus Hydrogenisulfobacillus filiaventi TaxID=2707344 RepID=A0A6F8ZJR7_9FIRM|nr:Molybdopterin molybdenumtransferase [Candidatus Hydrogenisulfobacillus filiaventi]
MLMSVEEAQHRILDGVVPPPPESRSLSELLQEAGRAWPRILAAPLVAEADVPPFANSSMDGFAVRAADVAGAAVRPVTLRVIGRTGAGHLPPGPLEPGTAVQVMTGAPLPAGADAVVPVEWTRMQAGAATVTILQPVRAGSHVRPRGQDMRQGSRVLEAGTRLDPPVLGIAASLGAVRLPVYPRPRVAIVSTGDELVDPGQIPGPGQIRNSNAYALAAAVAQAGGEPRILPPLPDRLPAITAGLAEAARSAAVVVSSGGVSVGDYDFVKPALEQLGRLEFWRVNVKPGKPLAVGHVLDRPFLGLPGNPVSALVTFELFVRPLLLRLQGVQAWQRPRLQLPLGEDLEETSGRRQFLRCRMPERDGHRVVVLTGPQGSAIQTSWLGAEGLADIPAGAGPLRAGTPVTVWWLR